MKSIRIKKIKLNNYTIYYLFLFIMILDFGGAFGIRYASLLFVLAYVFLKMINKSILIPKRFILIEGTLFVLFPMLILLYSVTFYSTSLTRGISEINTLFLWFFYLVLINLDSKDSLLRPFKKIGFLCIQVIIGVFLLMYFFISTGQYGVIEQITTFAQDYRVGFIGIKPSPDGLSYSGYPNVYFRWTMILIPISILFLKEKKLKFILVMTSIILISSTGLLIFSLIGIALFYVADSIAKRNFMRSFAPLLLGVMIIVVASYFFDVSSITDKLSTDSNSTSIKLGHISSAMLVIFATPSSFLFGTGLGTEFFSSGIQAMTSEIEVSHINLIRQFGMLYFILFTLYVLTTTCTLMKMDETGRMLGAGLLSFFIAAGTNPLLLSPIFIMFLIICKAYLTISKRDKAVLEHNKYKKRASQLN